MRVLVTGATGFVGGQLVPELCRLGLELRLLVRDRRKAQRWSAAGAELVEGDLFDAPALARGCVGVDAVLHVAGLTKTWRAAEFERVNVEGTRQLAQAAVNAGVGRFLLVSSLAAAGPSGPDRPRTEEDPPAPVSAYGRSKLGGERVASEVLAARGVRLAILRPPIVYGEGDRDFFVVFQQVARGLVPLVGGRAALEKRFSLVHVRDLARGLAGAVARADLEGSYFLPGPQDASFGEVIALAGRAVGRQPRMPPVPAWLAWPVALALESAASALRKTTIVSRDKLTEAAQPGWACSGDRARAAFGYAPSIALEEGFASAVAWYRKEGWL